MKRWQGAVTALMAGVFVLLTSGPAKPGTIYFSTIASNYLQNGVTYPGHYLYMGEPVPTSTGWNWNYTGNPSDTAYYVYVQKDAPYVYAPYYINNFTIGPGGLGGSNNIPGNGLSSYPGFEFMYFHFNLPANATNVNLHLSTQNGADDRYVLSINNWQIGGYNSGVGAGNSTTVTTMKDGFGTHTVTIYGFSSAGVDLNNPAWFNIGGANFLRFWINNTNGSLYASAIPHVSFGDSSYLRMAGYISYDTPPAAPLPSTLFLLGSGLLGLAGWRRLKKV